MEKNEAKTALKALYLQSASIAGYEVSPHSPERFADLVEEGYDKIAAERRAEATVGALKVMSETLLYAQENKLTHLSESTVDAGKDRACPVYPFD